MRHSMLKKVFIANRGEIARRIGASLRKLSIQSVCLTDREHPPIYLRDYIDFFEKVEEEESSKLYLNPEKIIGFALKHQCDGIHPGFGFLSENATFAQMVQSAGLTWIGPPPKAMETMADKAESKELAEKLSIPCTQGIKDIQTIDSETIQAAENLAKEVGYPLLIKASKGGGGKGMRLVHKREEIENALKRASSEALNSFGDRSIILEQYIENSRHIEVQLIGDESGSIHVLGDRDCSLQRRHQKIIEEAPAPMLHKQTRVDLHKAAKKLAAEVSYSSVGTVEFILDNSTGHLSKQKFYFLEMNTRLQVEHPVTEEIFGIDLLAWQIRVAQGGKLPDFSKLQARGHSIEARIYAENPYNNFFPAPGKIDLFEPFQASSIRWELGIDSSDEILPHFDPMIAKIISRGETREEAIDSLSFALNKTIIFGPENNREYLAHLLKESDFYSIKPCNTQFIGQYQKSLLDNLATKKNQNQDMAEEIFKFLIEEKNQLHFGEEQQYPSQASIERTTQYAFQPSKNKKIPNHSDQKISISSLKQIFLENSPAMLTGIGGYSSTEKIVYFNFMYIKESQGDFFHLFLNGFCFKRYEKRPIWQGETTQDGQKGEICAPVPGKVIKLDCKPDQKIQKNQVLFILESMKMEFEVKSPSSGKISKVHVQPNQQVQTGEILAHLEESQ